MHFLMPPFRIERSIIMIPLLTMDGNMNRVSGPTTHYVVCRNTTHYSTPNHQDAIDHMRGHMIRQLKIHRDIERLSGHDAIPIITTP